MTLFKYEMQKLLFNRSRLILLAVMFVVYALMAFLISADFDASLEPALKGVGVWFWFFLMFDGMLLIMFLLLMLTFFISPLFTQEVHTDMDSIVLCSMKGRREIVSAKLGAAAATSAIVAITYLVGAFTGMCLGNGIFSGFDVPAQNFEQFARLPFAASIGLLFLISLPWLIFASVVFGLVLALISCKMKTQSAAFGIGIVVLLSGLIAGAIPESLRKTLWPFIDFNFAALANFINIFGTENSYSFFGVALPYWAAALMVGGVIAFAACLLTYLAQKRRQAN